MTGNRPQVPELCKNEGLLAAEPSVGPQTGQCRDPGSTIADFEPLVIDEPATEECNLERTAQASDRHVRAKAELRKLGKRGGRASRLGRRAVSRLMRILAEGKSQAECASLFDVSVRTIGRTVARTRSSEKRQTK